ncbi:hypothetical protein ABXV24_04080 [Vibrio owensii]|uniref:hypothetical protein n=1 Tax=Vibrio owensii TaxID=696485 RepID=UPI003397046F
MIDYDKVEKVVLSALIIDKYVIDIDIDDIKVDDIYEEAVEISENFLRDFTKRWVVEYIYIYKDEVSNNDCQELIYSQLFYMSQVLYVRLSDEQIRNLALEITLELCGKCNIKKSH